MKKLFQQLRLFLILVFIVFLVNCKTEKVKVTFFYTNDIHGQIIPIKKHLENEQVKKVGGFSRLKTYIDDYKKHNRDRLIFISDSGDIFQGTPEGGLTDGKMIIEGMEKIGFKITTLGNHEFDLGEDKLEDFIKSIRFDVVCANVENKNFKIPKYKVYKYGDYKLVVTGILTTETLKIIGENNLKKFVINDEIESLNKIYPEIENLNPDLFICLSHCGTDFDSVLISKFPYFDLVFGGHDHNGKEKPLTLPGIKTMAFSTNGKLFNLGQLELTYDLSAHKIINYKNKLVELDEKVKNNKEIDKFIKEKSKDIDKIMNVQIGNLISSLPKISNKPDSNSKWVSSKIGNFVTDVLKKAAGTDIAIYNNSGIRGELGKGKVLFRDVYNVEPFGNSIYKMKIKGSDLKNFIESVLNDGYHRVQVSGCYIKYYKSRKDDLFKLKEFRLDNDSLIYNSKIYTVAVPSYIGDGNDGYLVFKKAVEKIDSLKLIRDELKKEISLKSNYNYNFKNRIIYTGEK